MEIVGQIVGGEHGAILLRQKSGEALELGELLVCGDEKNKMLLQVFDLLYGSQLDASTLEMVSGLNLENISSDEIAEGELRNYVLAKVKALLEIRNGKAMAPKKLPRFFDGLRKVEERDFDFLEKSGKPLFLGNIRSGSKVLPVRVELDGEKVLSHHCLVAAATGKGKSNLLKVMLQDLLERDYCGILVLDPHNEYYKALRGSDRLKAYSMKPEAGAISLLINLSDVKPWHLKGVMQFTDAQEQAMMAYYKKNRERWIDALMNEETGGEEYNEMKVHPGTISVLQRKVGLLLDERVFRKGEGESTVKNVVSAMAEGKKVIVDTSRLSSETELLIGSILASAVFEEWKQNEKKIVASIVLEEAPRVLSEAAGPNVFSSIAREGRKFNVGLIAITQLASMIPREVLANLNTKIILGNEMAQEREALIASAAQDLSMDSKSIAGLDKGEAIVTSVFGKFAIPVQVPLFQEMRADGQTRRKFI